MHTLTDPWCHPGLLSPQNNVHDGFPQEPHFTLLIYDLHLLSILHHLFHFQLQDIEYDKRKLFVWTQKYLYAAVIQVLGAEKVGLEGHLKL